MATNLHFRDWLPVDGSEICTSNNENDQGVIFLPMGVAGAIFTYCTWKKVLSVFGLGNGSPSSDLLTWMVNAGSRDGKSAMMLS